MFRGMRRSRFVLFCILFFCLGFLTMEAASAKTSPLLELSEETGSAVQSFEGLVVHASFKTDRWDLMVRTAEEKVLVRLDAPEEARLAVCSLTGRICRFTGPVRRPDGRRNFGCFDYALYLKGRDVRWEHCASGC